MNKSHEYNRSRNKNKTVIVRVVSWVMLIAFVGTLFAAAIR